MFPRIVSNSLSEREWYSNCHFCFSIRKRENPGLLIKKPKAEEEKNREEKAKAEEARQKDKKEKELAALRKIDAAPKKKVNTATAQKKGAKSAADEIKKKEKEEKTQ